MSKYKVKSLYATTENEAVNNYKEWIESREHITIVSTNILQSSAGTRVVVTYMEERYDG